MSNEDNISFTPRPATDWAPEWAPWAVLGTLISVGVLGGLGILPLGFLKRSPSAVAPSARAPAALPAAASSAGPGPEASSKEPSITASHLVVSHGGSRLGQHRKITRTREEARARADEALARARKGEAFEKLVVEYSDEPKAAERKGLIGTFARRHAPPGFGDAAFALKPGQISGVVETPLGFHVILRTQ